MDLSPPTNTKAEVLSALIENGSVSIKNFSWMEGFRTRVSELALKHSIPLLKTTIVGLNKHGNTIRYIKHSLPPKEVNNAIQVYNLINKAKN